MIGRFTRSPIITVVVGKGGEAQSFLIYKDLLTAHSPYFKACLNSAWEEGKTDTVRLEDDDPKAFETITNWLFRDPSTMEQIDMRSTTDVALAYKLADKLLMTQLKNHLLDEYRAFQLANRSISNIGALDFLCEQVLQRTHSTIIA